MSRSPASHFVQAVGKAGSGTGWVRIFVDEGKVLCKIGPVELALTPEQARWLSHELAVKALMTDGKAVG
jgi:hypothetical protein